MSRGLSQKMSRKFSGIPKPQRCCAVLDEDECKKNWYRPEMGGANFSSMAREITIINESGLYNAALGSTKPEAKAFKKWVTSGSAALHPETRRIHRGERQHFTGPNFRPSFIWDGFTISPPIKLWTGADIRTLSQIWVKAHGRPVDQNRPRYEKAVNDPAKVKEPLPEA